MKIAAAQLQPYTDRHKNLEQHYLFVEQAAREGASLIVFPEMSLTGYEKEFVDEIAYTKDDARLEKLKSMSASLNIAIIAGTPIKIDGQL